jgi:hypothetical protein
MSCLSVGSFDSTLVLSGVARHGAVGSGKERSYVVSTLRLPSGSFSVGSIDSMYGKPWFVEVRCGVLRRGLVLSGSNTEGLTLPLY